MYRRVCKTKFLHSRHDDVVIPAVKESVLADTTVVSPVEYFITAGTTVDPATQNSFTADTTVV
jgi:hypothetical protein